MMMLMAGLGLWALTLVGIYVSHYPIRMDAIDGVMQILSIASPTWITFAPVAKGFAVAALTLAGCAFTGERVLRRVLPADSLLAGEGFLFGGMLGLGVLATATLVLGALGFWTAGVFAALLVLLGVPVFIRPIFGEPLFPLPAARGQWTWLWSVLLILTVALYGVGAACPEIFYDSLHYHLAVPSLYEQVHRILPIPTMLYSSFISTVQMLFGFVHAMGGAFAAKALHSGLALLLIPAYVLFSRRYFLSTSGLLAALLVLSMPMVGINATTAGTDVAGAFFIFVSAFALVRALEHGDRRWFWLAGVLTGIAGSCKYPTLPFIPIAAILIFCERRRPMDVVHFLAAATLGVIPLLAKNVWLYGNPIYPFLGTTLGTPRIDPLEWQKFMADTNAQSLGLVFSSRAAFVTWITQPWTMSMGGSGTVGPLLLMGLPFLALGRAPSLAFRTLRRYALVAWLLWLATTTVPRYSLPAVVLTAPLIAEALFQMPVAAWARRLVLAAFALGILANLHLQLLILFNWNGWQVLAGRLPEATYLSRMWATYPTPPYEALIWMNQNLPVNAKVLFAGESRSYYLKRKSIPSSIPGVQPVVAWSRDAHSGAELAARMRAEGVTHLFLNYMEAMRTDSYHVFSWDPASWAVFDDFWSHHMRLIWRKENGGNENPQALYVFELVSESEASKPHPPTPNPFERWKPK